MEYFIIGLIISIVLVTEVVKIYYINPKKEKNPNKWKKKTRYFPLIIGLLLSTLAWVLGLGPILLKEKIFAYIISYSLSLAAHQLILEHVFKAIGNVRNQR